MFSLQPARLRTGGAALLFSCFAVAACNRDDDAALTPSAEPLALPHDLGAQPARIQTRLTAIAELAEVLEVVMLDDDVREEVYDVAMQPRYLDRYVALSDVLAERTDGAEEIRPARHGGAFREAFAGIFNATDYPALAEYVDRIGTAARSGGDGELFLYCPYCEEYNADELAGGFTVVANTFVEGADAGPGAELQPDGTYKTVTTNDAYAAATPTIIATGEPDGGAGAITFNGDTGYNTTICDEVECCVYSIFEDGSLREENCYPQGSTPPGSGGGGSGGGGGPRRGYEDCRGIDAVWTGVVLVTKQYDSWLGSVNTGGSEMRLGRVGSDRMVETEGGHIEAAGFSTHLRRYVSRYQISREKKGSWNTQFNPDWPCNDAPQFFLYYEEDEANEETFGYAIKPKFKVEIPLIGETEIGQEIGYEVTIRSDDDVIWSQTYERDVFFAGNRRSTGCGTEDGWARYACDNGWFTMPERYF